MSGGWRMGKVAQVDRVRRVVRGQLEYDYSSGEPPPVFEARYHGDPPWPLSQVRLAQVGSGVWECFGPIGDRQVILHEDFGNYLDISDSEQHFDHVWQRHRPGSAGSLAIFGDLPVPDGALKMETGSIAGEYINIRRGDVLSTVDQPPGVALWLSVQMSQGGVDGLTQVAFANLAAADFNAGGAFTFDDVFIGFRYDTEMVGDNQWVFHTARDATTQSVNTGVSFAGDTEQMDIIVRGDQDGWAAGWITRIVDSQAEHDAFTDVFSAGPFVIEGLNWTSATDTFSPTVGVYPVADIDEECFVYSVHVEMVNPVVHPTRDLIVGASGFQL